MARQQTDTTLSRRRLLQVAGGAAGLVGLAGAADRVDASGCPRPPRYWASADWPDNGRFDSPYTLVDPADERSVAVWRLLLSDVPDDRGAAVARQLLAARLNFQRRPPEDPDCVDRPLAAHDGRTVREMKAAAREWLRASRWPADQPDWVVDGVDGRPLYEALGRFNDGQLELSCTCDPFGAGGDGDWENPWSRDGPRGGRAERDDPGREEDTGRERTIRSDDGVTLVR